MINIEGKTQEQIEEMFSKENMFEYMAVELSTWVNRLEVKHYTMLQEVAKTDENETAQLMLDIIALIGTETNGTIMSLDFPHIREFDINQMVLGISSYLDTDVLEKYTIAMDIIAEFDTIFWDIEQENVLGDTGHWYTKSSCIVDFIVAEGASKLQMYSRYKLPLIETPTDWVQGQQQGGYHLNVGKCTLNKGASQQPQEVLDVLNSLQHQAYMLRETDFMAQHKYTFDRLKVKNWKKSETENLETVTVKLQTVMESYDTMRNQEFYLAWKYDFRGRAYCEAYDITLQGDSYQKSLLKPVFK